MSLERRSIPGFPGYLATSGGEIVGLLGRRLHEYVDGDGYRQVSVHRPGRRNAKRVAVHVLVALAFHGARPLGAEVRHLNDRRSDCRPANLAWGTTRENADDRVRAGSSRGARNGRAKLTPAIAQGILARHARGESQDAIAAVYRLGQSTISRVVRGVDWTARCANG